MLNFFWLSYFVTVSTALAISLGVWESRAALMKPTLSSSVYTFLGVVVIDDARNKL